MELRNIDIALLQEIAAIAKHSARIWEGGRYRRRGVPVPRASLKRLAECGYCEVESHAISTWAFGPVDLPWPEEQNWHRAHPREFESCTEVWARITPMGQEFLATQ